MPAAEAIQPDDKERDRDPERGERTDRGGSKQKSPSTSGSKSSKDLSHVPCKFFKVGGCTAGSSCPFSHAAQEPGGQKETCAWFVKGNCKFGHKCALAHILPGQTIAMDRKNKKAAQVAAAAANAERGDKPEKILKDGKGLRGGNNIKRDGPATAGSSNSGNRNPLLGGGSTAPTRMSSSTQTGRPPMSMPLKATLTPSAPAPPLASFGVLEDLESAGVQLATAPAQVKQTAQDNILTSSISSTTEKGLNNKDPDFHPTKRSSPHPLPASEPRPAATPKKPAHDFGPIGSPSSGTSPRGVNGININPGTPDNTNSFSSSSPFSAPGTQSIFISGNGGGGAYNGSTGLAASLGSGLAIMGGGRRGWGSSSNGVESANAGFGGMAPSSMQQQRANGGVRNDFDISVEYEDYNKRRPGLGIGKPVPGRGQDVAVEDEDLEDFLPSSLTELLTPEERSRRMSRSNSGQGAAAGLAIGVGGGGNAGLAGADLGGSSPGGNSGLGMGHRYSRSVPAPSLLGDIKSIWAENKATPLPSSPPAHRGTPSTSFMPRLDGGLGPNSGTGDDMLSMSIGSGGAGGMTSLSPSNASAAFLPGLHAQYLTAKAKQAQAQQLGLGGLGRGIRNTSSPLFGGTGSNIANNYLLSGGGGGGGGGSAASGATSANAHLHTHTNPQTNAHHTYRTTPSPFDLTQQHQQLHQQQPHTARPIPSNPSSTTPHPEDGAHLLSPGTRALQAHAPGQSLPQGLAAGYSRIHALPPPPSLASPGSASAFGSSGTPPAVDSNSGIPGSGPYGGWNPLTHTTAVGAASPPANNGLDSMFSHLSYSAATATRGGGGGGSASGVTASMTPVGNGIGGNATPTPTTATPTPTPPGLSRNVSGGKYPHQQQQGPLSPLSGPVVTRDDDDELFSMDG